MLPVWSFLISGSSSDVLRSSYSASTLHRFAMKGHTCGSTPTSKVEIVPARVTDIDLWTTLAEDV
ncbi:hypothetical protein MJO28_012426 [Puccinia striiformis f. sp. tritici]|uniref:Uncharacterized protein n=1 Tax=Puccinia striiformis f. sp. tritici TaxID=168172 RepID=A0ACC0DZV0_9BASI|nr:hypothetical protein MJO28_012426 [Puccinia striiformis f. sp. tritici]